MDQPAYVREAAERLEAAGQAATRTDQVQYAVSSDVTNLPNVVRGYDGMGREDAQGSVWANGPATIPRSGSRSARRRQTISIISPSMLDNSYITERVGNVAVYAGYVTHWWGPGWDTALSLSDNARPFPQRLSSSFDECLKLADPALVRAVEPRNVSRRIR